MGLFLISNVFKNLYLPILLHSFPPVQFLEQFPSPLPIPHFFSLSQPYFHKPYLQYKTILNIWAVHRSAVSCCNVVLIVSPSSSMQFLSFFDVLRSVPTTTGITWMAPMLQVSPISPLSSWHLSTPSSSFSSTLMSPGLAITIMAQLFSFLFTTTMSGFPYVDPPLKLDPNISQNHHFFIFRNIFIFRLHLPHNHQWTIPATLFYLLLYSFCANFSHSLTVRDIVSLFPSHILQTCDWALLSILCFT